MAQANAAADAFHRRSWLPSAHLETIMATLMRRHPPMLDYTREIIRTRDGDDIALDYVQGEADAPLLVLFHGLEGCSQSSTTRTIAGGAAQKGWTVAVPHFRGCGGVANRLPRAYHAADAAEVGWMIAYCQAYFPHSRIFAAGTSLGGTALIHYLLKNTFHAPPAATISTPFDLYACVRKLDSGFNRRVYARHFLKTLRPKIFEKAKRFPTICDLHRLRKARTFSEFDELYTAPIHGFNSALSYWRKASISSNALEKITSPLLCINALNDPLIPADTLPPPPQNKMVSVCRPRHGAHAGFVGTPANWLFDTIYHFFQQQAPAQQASQANQNNQTTQTAQTSGETI